MPKNEEWVVNHCVMSSLVKVYKNTFYYCFYETHFKIIKRNDQGRSYC